MIRHGAYKTPGGKLIAVEFEVDQQRLRNVVVTGDFFLYPEDALPLLTRALEGAPATLPVRGYAELVQPVLSDVELLGSSAEGLAAAVARALADPPDSADAT